MENRKQSVTILSLDEKKLVPRRVRVVREEPENVAEKDLVRRLTEQREGKSLLEFCRELAGIVMRRYRVENEASEVRRIITADLRKSLKCTKLQADSLFELALEVIHVKIHGRYQRTGADLTFLIAKAGGVVRNVSLN